MKGGIKGEDICLVGHPYAPTGRGEDVRCTYRALRNVAFQPGIVDIYSFDKPEEEALKEFSGACSNRLSNINVFHLNGDEVQPSLVHLGYALSSNAYNIVYPAWELARYPNEWVIQLDKFDEIWAPSRFIQTALESVCSKPVIHMPLACEVVLSSFYSRRYFGIPEAKYVFLFFFDVRSYIQRKNPDAVVEAFRRLLSGKNNAKVKLVLKINGSDLAPQAMSELKEKLKDITNNVIILDHLMSDNEVKNLIRCCNCFISLHRSEGFGRGIAEAMHLGKPVIATAYSGNMDFMTSNTSLEVGYQLISVGDGEYPHWKDQVWAEADVEQAVKYMKEVIYNPEKAAELGRKASIHIRTKFGYRARGLAYLERFESIAR